MNIDQLDAKLDTKLCAIHGDIGEIKENMAAKSEKLEGHEKWMDKHEDEHKRIWSRLWTAVFVALGSAFAAFWNWMRGS